MAKKRKRQIKPSTPHDRDYMRGFSSAMKLAKGVVVGKDGKPKLKWD
jgi:hypothetical protein